LTKSEQAKQCVGRSNTGYPAPVYSHLFARFYMHLEPTHSPGGHAIEGRTQTCGQPGPSFKASRVALHGVGGTGFCHRIVSALPAYGIPRNTLARSSTTPRTGPLVVCTTALSAVATTINERQTSACDLIQSRRYGNALMSSFQVTSQDTATRSPCDNTSKKRNICGICLGAAYCLGPVLPPPEAGWRGTPASPCSASAPACFWRARAPCLLLLPSRVRAPSGLCCGYSIDLHSFRFCARRL
jgi:hypothetical protein